MTAKIIVPDGFHHCSTCKQILPATNEYFHGKKKLDNNCKKCRHEIYLANAERDKTRAAKWWDEHKDEANEKRREQRKVDPRIRQLDADWRKKNRDKVRQYKHDSYVRNKPRILEQQRASAKRRSVKLKAYRKKYYALNADKIKHRSKVSKAKRRTIEVGLGIQYTAQDWRDCLTYFDYKCAVCGQPENMWVTLAADHWIPISDRRLDNPGTVRWNIIPLCHSKKGIPFGTTCCNQLKGKKDPIQWLTEHLGKRKAKKKLAEIEAYFESVRTP